MYEVHSFTSTDPLNVVDDILEELNDSILRRGYHKVAQGMDGVNYLLELYELPIYLPHIYEIHKLVNRGFYTVFSYFFPYLMAIEISIHFSL